MVEGAERVAMGPGGWGLAETGKFVSGGRRVFSSSGPRPRQGARAHGGRRKTEKPTKGGEKVSKPG